jgi:hypothetical protein
MSAQVTAHPPVAEFLVEHRFLHRALMLPQGRRKAKAAVDLSR